MARPHVPRPLDMYIPHVSNLISQTYLTTEPFSPCEGLPISAEVALSRAHSGKTGMREQQS